MSHLAGTSALIVGSGIGGLSTACYLADAGADVRVLEKNEQLGGRASVLERDGFRFDMGPSWYLMPDVFERFFGSFDRTPGDYYSLIHLDPHYRIFFKDGDAVTISANRERTKQLFESYEDGAGESLERYLEKSRENYEVGMKHFVYEDRTRLRDYLDPDVARQARGLSLLGTMQGHVEQYFDHPKLQQIMQYTLVFLGGSPTTTPALYNLMSHVDFNLGVWYPEGGLKSVVDGIVELGTELGVTYETNAPVTAIKGRRGGFLVEIDSEESTEDSTISSNNHVRSLAERERRGEAYAADIVVSNADYAHTEQELLDPQKRGYDAEYWESRTYAPSAFLLYLGVEGDLEELAHHTLVLPTNWSEHFEQIFEEPAWPDDPAYYVCTPSRTDDGVAPEGHSALFVLVPIAPDLADTPEHREQYRDRILDDLATNAGTELRDRIVLEERFSVSEFADRYNSYRGSALGMAHTLRQTSLFRPSRRSEEVDGLYFTGSYTTPGIGVPMCLISGELTADAVVEDITR